MPLLQELLSVASPVDPPLQPSSSPEVRSFQADQGNGPAAVGRTHSGMVWIAATLM